MKTLTIGEAARRAGVGVETVRFYERKGLLPEPPRRDSGYRQYPEDVVARLRFIRRAKELGFSLKEIKELLALRVDPGTTCAEVKRRAEEKIIDVEAKIEALLKIREALVGVTAECRGLGPTSQCPILEAMEAQEAEPGRIDDEPMSRPDARTSRS